MGLLKSLVRPLVPRSIRRKAHEARIRREIQIWKDLGLNHDFCGIRVTVSSISDWTVFNEIFVDGVYDRAIAHVLSHTRPDKKLQVLDLGANVGFFTIRFCQRVFQSDHPERAFTIHCVEGSPQVYAELSARIDSNPRVKKHVVTRHGLVGKRMGSAEIYESLFGAGNSVIAQHYSKPVEVAYIDLDTLPLSDGPIALLKCDIEGNEQLFQDQYHDLLLRTDFAVVEVHHGYVDMEKFNRGMRAAGFCQPDVLWEKKAGAKLINSISALSGTLQGCH